MRMFPTQPFQPCQPPDGLHRSSNSERIAAFGRNQCLRCGPGLLPAPHEPPDKHPASAIL